MTEFNLFSKAPNGELHTKWEEYKKSLKKLAPEDANKYKVIVVGTGLAGASASATLAEHGFNVHAFSFHESPRRAHSICLLYTSPSPRDGLLSRMPSSA